MDKHTYNYGLIGNCSFLALVNTNTNIGWLCWPRFDSSFLFGGLLDTDRGGEFSIRPETDDFTSRQYYEENTNVLITEIETPDGAYRVTDFAPRFMQFDRYFKPLMLCRKVEVISGKPRIRVVCQPRGDYGKIVPEVLFGSNHIRYMGLDRQVRLTTSLPLSYVAEEQAFVLTRTNYMTLTWGVPLEDSLDTTVEVFYQKTSAYWQRWVKRTAIGLFSQEAVIRSGLTLKLHQYEDTGAIIAATTTSLPESPGSTRNWDYRYCWIRDSHYTLKALNSICHFTELEEFALFIQNIAMENNRYQPLYSITGQTKLVEHILDLDGYLGEKPVRVGNQAYEHIQNDVYGQVLVSLLPLFTDQRLGQAQRKLHMSGMIMQILRKIEETMYEPDAGLWEFRNKSQLHCYTFLFHWAGAKAGIKMAEHFGDADMLQLAQKLEQESVQQIEACYDESRGVYTQAVGTPNLDASLLQLITMHYLDPQSERAHKHLAVLEEHLKTPEGLFYRYKHEDDFGAPETTFLICAFWYIEALATVGRVEEAVAVFNNLLKYRNHLGLLSEDVHAETGSQWGNFPQAYSHVGLVNAAFAISRKMDKQPFL